ncbi:unnamed protein product [Closterium sp. Yama58-4]|nr:unnamed protein product [Closterium sp. Yama58-4]
MQASGSYGAAGLMAMADRRAWASEQVSGGAPMPTRGTDGHAGWKGGQGVQSGAATASAEAGREARAAAGGGGSQSQGSGFAFAVGGVGSDVQASPSGLRARTPWGQGLTAKPARASHGPAHRDAQGHAQAEGVGGQHVWAAKAEVQALDVGGGGEGLAALVGGGVAMRVADGTASPTLSTASSWPSEHDLALPSHAPPRPRTHCNPASTLAAAAGAGGMGQEGDMRVQSAMGASGGRGEEGHGEGVCGRTGVLSGEEGPAGQQQGDGVRGGSSRQQQGVAEDAGCMAALLPSRPAASSDLHSPHAPQQQQQQQQQSRSCSPAPQPDSQAAAQREGQGRLARAGMGQQCAAGSGSDSDTSGGEGSGSDGGAASPVRPPTSPTSTLPAPSPHPAPTAPTAPAVVGGSMGGEWEYGVAVLERQESTAGTAGPSAGAVVLRGSAEGSTPSPLAASAPPAASLPRTRGGDGAGRMSNGDARGAAPRAATEDAVILTSLDDGWHWRKYGEKPIVDNYFPREYYKCSLKRGLRCPALRQVERCNDDPSKFRVFYNGAHNHDRPLSRHRPAPSSSGLMSSSSGGAAPSDPSARPWHPTRGGRGALRTATAAAVAGASGAVSGDGRSDGAGVAGAGSVAAVRAGKQYPGLHGQGRHAEQESEKQVAGVGAAAEGEGALTAAAAAQPKHANVRDASHGGGDRAALADTRTTANGDANAAFEDLERQFNGNGNGNGEGEGEGEGGGGGGGDEDDDGGEFGGFGIIIPSTADASEHGSMAALACTEASARALERSCSMQGETATPRHSSLPSPVSPATATKHPFTPAASLFSPAASAAAPLTTTSLWPHTAAAATHTRAATTAPPGVAGGGERGSDGRRGGEEGGCAGEVRDDGAGEEALGGEREMGEGDGGGGEHGGEGGGRGEGEQRGRGEQSMGGVGESANVPALTLPAQGAVDAQEFKWHEEGTEQQGQQGSARIMWGPFAATLAGVQSPKGARRQNDSHEMNHAPACPPAPSPPAASQPPSQDPVLLQLQALPPPNRAEAQRGGGEPRYKAVHMEMDLDLPLPPPAPALAASPAPAPPAAPPSPQHTALSSSGAPARDTCQSGAGAGAAEGSGMGSGSREAEPPEIFVPVRRPLDMMRHTDDEALSPPTISPTLMGLLRAFNSPRGASW